MLLHFTHLFPRPIHSLHARSASLRGRTGYLPRPWALLLLRTPSGTRRCGGAYWLYRDCIPRHTGVHTCCLTPPPLCPLGRRARAVWPATRAATEWIARGSHPLPLVYRPIRSLVRVGSIRPRVSTHPRVSKFPIRKRSLVEIRRRKRKWDSLGGGHSWDGTVLPTRTVPFT